MRLACTGEYAIGKAVELIDKCQVGEPYWTTARCNTSLASIIIAEYTLSISPDYNRHIAFLTGVWDGLLDVAKDLIYLSANLAAAISNGDFTLISILNTIKSLVEFVKDIVTDADGTRTELYADIVDALPAIEAYITDFGTTFNNKNVCQKYYSVGKWGIISLPLKGLKLSKITNKGGVKQLIKDIIKLLKDRTLTTSGTSTTIGIAGLAKTPIFTGITGIGGVTFNPNGNDDFIDVIVHSEGGGYVIWIDEKQTVVTEATLATLLTPIKATNKTIRLLSCSDLESATRLSIALGNYSVIASDDAVILYSDGTVESTNWYKLTGNTAVSVSNATPPKANTDLQKFVRLGPPCVVCTTRQPICARIDKVYNRLPPSQRSNAEIALKRICDSIPAGKTGDDVIINLTKIMRDTTAFTTADLNTFLLEVNGVTNPVGTNTNFLSANVSKLHVKFLKAWLKLRLFASNLALFTKKQVSLVNGTNKFFLKSARFQNK